MLPRTIFLSRLLGLWVLIIALAVMLHKTAMVSIAADFGNAPGLLFISGVFTVLAGLAMVLGHNIWTGGAAPVVVTLVGWAMLIKGIGLVFISPGEAAGLLAVSRFAEYAYVYGGVLLVLGLYLTYAGFLADHAKRYSGS
jgi:hypothetical protein